MKLTFTQLKILILSLLSYYLLNYPKASTVLHAFSCVPTLSDSLALSLSCPFLVCYLNPLGSHESWVFPLQIKLKYKDIKGPAQGYLSHPSDRNITGQ